MEEEYMIALYIFYAIYFLLIILKIYYRRKNKKLRMNKVLSSKICPYCKGINASDYLICLKCSKPIERSDKYKICFNCGYFGKMSEYKDNPEVLVTFLLLLPLSIISILYLAFNWNKKVCKSCGRMIRTRDFRISEGRSGRRGA